MHAADVVAFGAACQPGGDLENTPTIRFCKTKVPDKDDGDDDDDDDVIYGDG